MRLFLKKSVEVLIKYNRFKKYTIELKKSKQPSYEFIYSLKPIEFKIFQTYIKTNLTNGFIKLLKLLLSIPILFVQKFNNGFYLLINEHRLNNFMIKN